MKKFKTPIILYDGNCEFCNSSIDFIQRWQDLEKLRFVPINSLEDIYLRQTLQITNNIDSIVFINRKVTGEFFYKIKSDAIIYIAKYLRYPWKLFKFLKFLPKILRDLFYDLIAKYRFKINCKNNNCNLSSVNKFNAAGLHTE